MLKRQVTDNTRYILTAAAVLFTLLLQVVGVAAFNVPAISTIWSSAAMLLALFLIVRRGSARKEDYSSSASPILSAENQRRE